MPKLTQNQSQLLTEAARAERGVERTPETTSTAAGLIKRGFLIALPQADGPSRLIITEAGRAAMGAEPPQAPAVEAAPEAPAAPPEPKGKIGAVVTLLRRPEGATVEDMMQATGWQAHSVRGAIAGAIKKGLGLAVLSEKAEAGRVYRIVDKASA